MKKTLVVLLAVFSFGWFLTTSANADTPKGLHAVSGTVLTIGSSGPAVVKLQTRLRDLRYYCGTKVDGKFGAKTRRCVVDFQRTRGLEDDGVVGPITSKTVAKATVLRPNQCRGQKYCILTRIDQQVTYFFSPKIRSGVLIVGISSGSERPYKDVFTEIVNGKKVTRTEVGFAHTPRGWGVLGERYVGNQTSRLCEKGRPCMIHPMYIDGGPFGYHTFAYHGSANVLVHPASHGCIRTPTELMLVMHAAFPKAARTRVGVIGKNFDVSRSSS